MMSATIITDRFIQRSTNAPANKPNIRKAEVLAALRRPIWNSVAPRIVTAITGSAKPLICEPNELTVWPTQSFMKPGWLVTLSFSDTR
jgi:hypothetical protein